MANSSHHGGGTSSTSQSGQQPQPPPPPPVDSPPSPHSPKHIDSSPPPPPTTNYPTHPQYPPPYGQGYPPPGYPNPHAYPPGYPAGYSSAYPNGYPGGYPPNNPYYGSQPHHHPGYSAEAASASTRCIRSFILCSFFMLIFMFLLSLIVSLALHPQLPVYKVVSLTTTNFTTTPSLGGEWNTKMTVENPNGNLKAYFYDFKVNIVYKDGVVAINYAPGFILNKKEVKDMEVKGWSSNSNQEMLEENTMDDLAKDQASGSATFGLAVNTVNAFRSDSFATRNIEMGAICEGLKVVFKNGTGTLDNGGKPIECRPFV